MVINLVLLITENSLLSYLFFANENSVPFYSYAISVKFCQRSENNSLKKSEEQCKLMSTLFICIREQLETYFCISLIIFSADAIVW